MNEEEKQEILKQAMNSVPPGWKNIVGKLVLDMYDAGWDGDLLQAKEKFGALRFYVSGETKEISNLIEQAEEDTWNTCIECGEKATFLSQGWVVPLCDKHATGEVRKHPGSKY